MERGNGSRKCDRQIELCSAPLRYLCSVQAVGPYSPVPLMPRSLINLPHIDIRDFILAVNS